MKLFLLILSTLLSFSVFAEIKLDINLKSKEKDQVIELKKKLIVHLDKTDTISIPNSNKIVEIKVTNKIPPEVTNKLKSNDLLLIELNVVDISEKKRSITSSAKIISAIGQEARMEKYEDESQKNATTSLKITATRI